MMQMLAAGGMTILSDGERKADTDNPRGYLEWERIKRLPQEPGCIAEAEGKVVKVVSRLLLSLPEGHEYRVIFMQRPLPEVLASQEAMMRRRGTAGAGPGNAIMTSAFVRHLREVDAWLDSKKHMRTLRVGYHDVLNDAAGTAGKLAAFLEMELDVAEMVRQVDASLYRNRG